MDNNATRPLINPLVRYRCTCGTDLLLDPDVGGHCNKCEKFISPKVLGHELAMTATLHDASFELVEPKPSSRTNSDHDSDTDDDNRNFAEQRTLPRLGDDALTTSNGQPLSLGMSASKKKTEDPDILIGAKYGHFEIVSSLGRGGMGQVYRALDTSLQRYVAVKLLRSGIGVVDGSSRSSDQEVDKLLQEAVSQARVTHPNIVTIYYVGKQDGDPFLAMELVNGKPLSARIIEGDLSFAEIASIATQICEALKFSFELDLIHGDLKPSNMLLQYNGIAKLSDFGMARSASGDDDNSIGGTPNYIAPELLKGEKPSLKSDVYAFGVTLYEMSFGQLPINLTGKTIREWADSHEANEVSFPHPWPDRFPESWRKVLSQMLAKDPELRYENYEDLLAELNRLTPHSQVIARPFPRIVAAGIDWIIVLVLAIVLQFALSFTTWSPQVTMLLRISVFLPIIIYTISVYFWRQSLGRSLMHIRVVNRYGLRPKPIRMGVRSLLRMQFPWFLIALSLFDDPTKTRIGVIIAVLVLVSGFALLLDVGFMVIFKRRRSLHDLICGTQVVLDTD